jgi:hypothetical protein
MAASQPHPTLSHPRVNLEWMTIALILFAFLSAVLYEQIWRAFLANMWLNGLIVCALIFGIIFAFRQVLRLYREIRWVNNFRVSDPGLKAQRAPVLLAPMAAMLRDRRGLFTLTTNSTRSILDSIASRLDEARDISRYLVGLLIFLGLLGTFWGLLETISSVGRTISALDTNAGDSLVVFEELKAGLEAPLSGMGTAFSSSLFGLAGSLILGFLDLQANQAQNRFYNELENWLAGATEIGVGDKSERDSEPEIRFALVDVQRSISDLGQKIEKNGANDNAMQDIKALAKNIEKLVTQMRNEQKIIREWADEQSDKNQKLATVIEQISDSAKSLSSSQSGRK